MKHFALFISLVAAVIISAALLAGCSTNDLPDGDELPDGKYPLTLTAAVEGQTVTRATADNSWAGGEAVALQVAGTPSATVLKYTAGANNILSAASGVTPPYWQNSTETKTVSAWYPYSTTRSTTFTVVEDQNSNGGAGFQQSDMLYAAPTEISFRSSELTFKHLPVKVVVNLKADTQNDITEAEVQSATVTLVNQALTSGAISYADAAGAVTPVAVAQTFATGTDRKVITPKVNAQPADANYQKTVQALLVPQQMRDRQFIKITIETGGVVRHYYYVPDTESEANLTAGKQYTYNITVKKEKLVVAASSSTTWTDDVTPGDLTGATFRVKFPTDKVSDVEVKEASNTTPISYNSTIEAYEVTTPTFTISYKLLQSTPLNFRYLLKQGDAAIIDRSATGGVITLTISTHGDLELTADERTEVADYYYSDGTWSDVLYTDKTCLGVVFHVGRHEKDNSDYTASSIVNGTIRGYVVALKNAGDWLKWEYGPNNQSDVRVGTFTDAKDWNGYSNQKTIEKWVGDNSATNWEMSHFPAANACANWGENNTPPNSNTYKAPTGSSGWFLPSREQLTGIYDNRTVVELALTKAGGGSFGSSYYYWSSSEHSTKDDNAIVVRLSDGVPVRTTKDDPNNSVRPVLAF